MSTTTSSPSPTPTPVVPAARRQRNTVGIHPPQDDSIPQHEQEKLVYLVNQSPRPVTMRELRLEVEQGRIPLVSIDRAEAGFALTGIRAGSAVAIVPNHNLNSIRVYYEGGIYTRPRDREPTSKEWCEYASLAASRAAERYPTVAMSTISNWDYLTQIGYVDVRPGQKLTVHLFGVNEGTAAKQQEPSNQSANKFTPACTVAEANQRPVIYRSDVLGGRGGSHCFQVRVFAPNKFIISYDTLQRQSNGLFAVAQVLPGIHDNLHAACAEADRNTRDWKDAAAEDRDDALEAHFKDQCREAYG